MFAHFNKTVYKVLFFIVVLLLMLTPVLPEKLEAVFTFLKLTDKMEHFIAFFLLSFLLNRASSTIAHRVRNIFALSAFGLFIEVMQYFIPNRSTSLGDLLADIAGIVAFQVLFSIYLTIIRKRNKGYDDE